MRSVLHVLISLALALVALASVIPTLEGHDSAIVQSFNADLANFIQAPDNPAGPDPSFFYHDGALLQVWVGKAKTNVGPVIGSQLYSIIWHLLDTECFAKEGNHACISDKRLCFETDSLVNGKVQKGNTCIWKLSAMWYSEDVRKLLIGAVAASLEALTKSDIGGYSNCYMMGDKKACNVGDAIRVNLRDVASFHNFIHIMISNGKTGYGYWDCCEGNERQLVDRAVDGLSDGFSKAFQQPFTRDTRCIIDGWKLCYE
ncbi:hypothetical protein DE146DRAFT_787415 [Phaeosphaeria sp. MPI-PUGE-AT-0046c]|nr:hypothetical protein DE146DRAFT_787415 [Phaeosphaeria sp. MPI-PUGE-AT-0046c]